jgi:hypothetical protein
VCRVAAGGSMPAVAWSYARRLVATVRSVATVQAKSGSAGSRRAREQGEDLAPAVVEPERLRGRTGKPLSRKCVHVARRSVALPKGALNARHQISTARPGTSTSDGTAYC